MNTSTLNNTEYLESNIRHLKWLAGRVTLLSFSAVFATVALKIFLPLDGFYYVWSIIRSIAVAGNTSVYLFAAVSLLQLIYPPMQPRLKWSYSIGLFLGAVNLTILLYVIEADLTSSPNIREAIEVIIIIMSALPVIVVLYLSRLVLRSAGTRRPSGRTAHLMESSQAGEVSNKQSSLHFGIPYGGIFSVPYAELGNGGDERDRVISTTIYRAIKADNSAKSSMIAMSLLVFFGVLASGGMWLYSQADSLRELKHEHLRLTILRHELARFIHTIKEDSSRVSLVLEVARISENFKEMYGEADNYKEALDRIEQKSSTSWPDIAVRVTIAALTLFLVQIFFHVHKYNRRLVNSLYAKAEALELIGGDSDAQKHMRKAVISTIIDASPTFDRGPRTPVEQALETIHKSETTTKETK